jgi:hypothetical protein
VAKYLFAAPASQDNSVIQSESGEKEYSLSCTSPFEIPPAMVQTHFPDKNDNLRIASAPGDCAEAVHVAKNSAAIAMTAERADLTPSPYLSTDEP